jgi:glutathione S-transferase
MITLFDVPLSPYAQKVKMALLEKGVPFETRIPDLISPTDELRAISPRLEVPVLVDDDFSMFDSTVMMEYLEDRFPESPLLPKPPRERARVRMLEEICDTAYDAVTWGVAEILVFKRADGALAETMLARAKQQHAGLNARLERDLQGREWLNGDSLGYGDVAAFPFVNGAASLGNKPAPGSRLEAWLKVMRGRESAARLKNDIMLTIQDFLNRPGEIAAGRAQRQYRDHRLDWVIRTGGLEIIVAGIKANNIRFSAELE